MALFGCRYPLRGEFDSVVCYFFFFNDPATTEIYTLPLHDALPISRLDQVGWGSDVCSSDLGGRRIIRSEEHTSELQSHDNLVCRLLLEKTHSRHLQYGRPSHVRPGPHASSQADLA